MKKIFTTAFAALGLLGFLWSGPTVCVCDNLSSGQCSGVECDDAGALHPGIGLSLVRSFPESPIIWSWAYDNAQNLYLGLGGPSDGAGTLALYTPDGTIKTLTKASKPAISAISIDGAGTLYFATLPGGSVYKLANGKEPETIFTPKQTYIWDMVCEGDKIWIATGGQNAALYCLSTKNPQSAEPVFICDQLNFTVLCLDGKGGVYAGSGASGLIYHVKQANESIQAQVVATIPGEEITEITLRPNGDLLVATFNGGSKALPDETSKAQRVIFLVSKDHGENALEKLRKEMTQQTPSASGGSIYCISEQGICTQLWTQPNAQLYTLFDQANGSILAGDGRTSALYQIDPNTGSWAIASHAEQGGQITALVGKKGTSAPQYALTSNPSGIYKISAHCDSCVYTSAPQDTGQMVTYGAMEIISFPKNSVTAQTRSGNTPSPNASWSAWNDLDASMKIISPVGRYLQYRLNWKDFNATVRQVRWFYAMPETRPTIEELRVLPIRVVYSPTQVNLCENVKIKELLQDTPEEILQNVGNKPGAAFTVFGDTGYMTAVWSLKNDPQGSVSYRVYERTLGSANWIALDQNPEHRLYSFCTRALSEGWHEIKIVASNPPSNFSDPLSATKVSAPFLVDNESPQLSVKATKTSPSEMLLEINATDRYSLISEANCTIFGSLGEREQTLIPVDGIFDSSAENFRIKIPNLPADNYAIRVSIQDECGNEANWSDSY